MGYLTSIDLAENNLDVEAVKALGRAISVSRSLTSINLANSLPHKQHVRSTDGPAFARALVDEGAFRGSMTECNLGRNDLGVEGWTIIFNALSDSASSKITKWDLREERLGPKIAAPLTWPSRPP